MVRARAAKKTVSPRTRRKPTKPEAVEIPLDEVAPVESETTADDPREFPTKEQIPLGYISLNAGTQSRTSINEATVNSYASVMEEGLWQWEREPIPKIYFDGENYYPGDGHHRIVAADRAGYDTILAEICSGTLRDAIFYSTSANQFHGLPRSNADKWNQVELLLKDEEWQKMSDRAIASHCGVSAPFVGKVRAELVERGTVNISSERVDKKGRKLNVEKISAANQQRAIAQPKEEGELVLGEMPTVEEIAPTIRTAIRHQLEIPGVEATEDPDVIPVADKVRPPEQTSKDALKAVAESQIELLSQEMGAKVVALLALDFCNSDELKEIHAELTAGLAALKRTE
ncbi:hypothetical protein C7B80_26680 [Cyanosarcina cf. burmensis CCALA 770]|nr:hypothetical protein C7B80_26680 [Cyanosarcina cf. burmensis CCALA 770]